ncbi:MAG: sigma-70 family RNA polymerase sigma factor [Gemmatimonadota bacterium]
MDETVRMGLSSVERNEATDRDFECFFRDHHERVFRALWLLSRDRHEAEEITQEAFLRLWERWGRVRLHADPVAYLYRTAMNVWRSRVRRAAVAARRTLHPPRERDELADVDGRDAVVRALAGLPPRQRAAIVLIDVLDLSSERAGSVLRIRPVTVRVLAARARARLASEIGGSGDD